MCLNKMATKTPTRKNNELTSIINVLSAKWNLRFPHRGHLWSPSQIENPNSSGEQVLSRLNFLSFKNKEALQYALLHFETHAVETLSGIHREQWIRKPRAELDVVPRRYPPSKQLDHESFLKRNDIDEVTASRLMDNLLQILDRVAACVRQKTNFRCLADISSFKKSQEEASLKRLHVIQTSQTSAFEWERLHRSISSDESELDNDTSNALADNMKNLSDTKSGTPSLLEQDEDEFRTAPNSPSQNGDTLLSNTDLYSSRKCDDLMIPDPCYHSRKRRYSDKTKSPEPRKVSRNLAESHLADYSEMNDDEPPRSLPDGTVQMEGRPSSADSMYDLGSTRSLLRPPSGLLSGPSSASMTSSTSESTLWTPQSSCNDDSFTASFGICVEPREVSDSGPVPSHNYWKRSEDTTLPNLDSASHRPVGNGKHNHMNDAHLMEHMHKDPANEIWSHRSPRATAAPPRAFNYWEHPVGTETLTGQGHGFAAADFFPSSLLSEHPVRPRDRRTVSFRQLYEVTRVSMISKLPMEAFSTCLKSNFDDYDTLWSTLIAIVRDSSKILPERSSVKAWQRASTNYDGVFLSGELRFSERQDGPFFDFALKPMKIEKSYRFARKFGGDRFCVIGIPAISSEYLPCFLKDRHIPFREGITNRLVDTDFHFSGRIWRAFYLKPENVRKIRRGNQTASHIKYRIYFFARDGYDFVREPKVGEADPRAHEHSPMSIGDLIDWFMPASQNLSQTCLKFYARLALGVSSTVPTVTFKPNEIVRNEDARSDAPNVRRLVIKKSPATELSSSPASKQSSIMNDGCARISKAAALAISDKLCIDYTPCVFQGRIAGAKGIWMVDALDEKLPSDEGEFWIEVTDSQLKFEGHFKDGSCPEKERITFEVSSFSKKLSSASLNFQLIPILLNRGVPENTFKDLLKADLIDRVGQLEDAMTSGLALRKWNQDTNPIMSERSVSGGIEMLGGLPASIPEKINWFVEHGFEPKECLYLTRLLFKAIQEYCLKLENRLNIGIGRSTSALIIADPLAILEEGEIHLGFSTTFRDPRSHWEEVMLHDIDVLVARLPAVLPSDIQKVRAVFKPELRIYRDVVIFSSKGSCSLAEKLSGGDYDGDRAWVCWEPTLVDSFENFPVPKCPSLHSYGIEKDRMIVADIYRMPDYTSQFLHHSFRFNLQTNLLGSCTTYHESLCYSHTRIDDPKAMAIGSLLGILVDRSKAGIKFDSDVWTEFLKRNKLPLYLPRPAYKNKDKAVPTKHTIDRLVFEDAKIVREDTLRKFTSIFTGVGSYDADLIQIYKKEAEFSQKDGALAEILRQLKVCLNDLAKYWANTTARLGGEDGDFSESRKGNGLSFAALVQKCRAEFLAISPSYEQGIDSFHVVRRWERACDHMDGQEYWNLLKASTLFFFYHRGKMVWHVAGIELGEIKATSKGSGTYRVVVNGVFQALKLDRKMAERVRKMELMRETERTEEGDEEEYGEFSWDYDE